MIESETSDGGILYIPHAARHDTVRFVRSHVEQVLEKGGTMVLPKGFEFRAREAPPTILKSEHYARVNELLATTNAYQERYRKAEAKLRDLGVTP
jgi:hypothetical protein